MSVRTPTPELIALCDKLIEDCELRAETSRRIAKAFQDGHISMGPHSPGGQMHPDTLEAIHRHSRQIEDAEILRDNLYDLRNGRIEYLP